MLWVCCNLRLSVCKHNGFCAVTFILVADPSEFLTQYSLAQNKGWYLFERL